LNAARVAFLASLGISFSLRVDVGAVFAFAITIAVYNK
jgi:hypothetical protein